jgi:hypothetical protein
LTFSSAIRDRPPRLSAAAHPYIERDADNDVAGDRKDASLAQPALVVAAGEEPREEPLRDRVVKAVEEHGRPQAACSI